MTAVTFRAHTEKNILEKSEHQAGDVLASVQRIGVNQDGDDNKRTDDGGIVGREGRGRIAGVLD